MKTKNIVNYLFFLQFLILLSCSNNPQTKIVEVPEVLPEDIVELNAEQYTMAGIQMDYFSLRPMNSTLRATGIITVSPQNLASVCAPLGGFVRNTDLVQGSYVRKGQVMVIMENPEFIDLQQKYLESLSQLEYAEAEYRRHQELYKDDIYSAMNFQQVTANYKSLKAEVNALGQKLVMTGFDPGRLTEDNISATVPVLSPLDGYITVVNVNLGKYVMPNDIMFQIVNTSDLTLELTLFEKDINKISVGQRINFSLPSDGNSRYDAVISQAGRAISQDKTVKVYADVKNPTNRILPGMFVNAWIQTSGDTLSALPTEAIVQFDEKDYIFIFEKMKKENNKDVTEFRMVEIKRGISGDGFTEIILPGNFELEKKYVVIKGAYNLMAAKKNAGEMSCG